MVNQRQGRKVRHWTFPSRENDWGSFDLIKVIALMALLFGNCRRHKSCISHQFLIQADGSGLSHSLIRNEISEYDNHDGQVFRDSKLTLNYRRDQLVYYFL